MAGKRRRGGSSRKAAPKAPTAEPWASQNAVNRLISQLFAWQKDPSTAVERLWKDETPVHYLSEDFYTSLVAESNTKNEMRSEDTLGYVLLLAAQTLERLALNPSDNAVSMAWLALAVAPLSCPPQQSDYMSTKAARHVAGRALLASTIAANQALMHLTATNHQKSNDDSSTAMAILAAILALDTTVGSSSSLIKDDTANGTTTRQIRQVWKMTRTSLQRHAEKYWLEQEQIETDSSNVWDKKMEACWSCIHGRDGEVSSSSLIDVFAQAIDQYYLITDHGSVSSRWVTMALTMNGEPSWLETCIALLDGPWMEYWSCPVVNNEPPHASSASASNRSVRSRGTDETIESATMYEFSGSVVAVMLVSRMLQLFRAVSKSASRKFNGQLHIYTNACWSSQSTDKTQDLRDTGTVLLYRILAVHRQCLDQMESPVVNDNDNIENTEALGSYYPFVNDVLENVSQLVSSSPSLALSHESQVQARNLLDGLAVAFVFQQHQKPNVIDARLVQHAMLQLVKALSQARSSHENASWMSKKTYTLPLEVPSLSAKLKGQRKKNATKSTFAGMFPGEFGPSHRGDAKLALVLRGVCSVGSWDTRCSAFLTLVLGLITSLYDTRNLEYPTTSAHKAPGHSSRTKSSSVPTHLRQSRSGKRRKVETVEHAHAASDLASWSRMSETRALVCSATLDVLSLCLRFPHNDHNLSQLQRLLRTNMSLDHVLGIIRLEHSLSAIFSRPVIDDHHSNRDGEPECLDVYTDGEKKLWSSHMNVCLTLGRGRVSFWSDDKYVLFGSRRMEVLKEISTTSSNGGELLWPLWLPPSHRVLVASNLVAEEIQSDCFEAELFIVHGAFTSIGDVLKSFAKWRFKEPSTEDDATTCSAYDEVLLSLDDARLILGAFCRLDKDNRFDSFAKLIHIVHSWIERISERPNDLTRLKEDFEASGFVSRVITFCSNAYSLMRFGSSMRRELVELIGSSQAYSVLLARRSPQYCAEKCFMGVLGKWEVSDDVSSSFRLRLEDVGASAEESLKHVLEAAFRLGFLTGQIDHGHLIFSAWNGLGKSDLWNMKNEVAPIPQGFVLAASNAPSLILELREDLCLVRRLLRSLNIRASLVPPTITAIDGQMTSKLRNNSELSQCLLAMVDKASTLVEIIMETNVSENLFTAVQCLLHILSTYVCFAASSSTRPKGDFLSNYSAMNNSSQKRKRGNSTESEASESEDASSDDEVFHSLEKLESICSKIGASPVHPDWLDVECTFLDRIDPDIALELAEKAQKCLTSLVAVCVREIKARQAAVFADQSPFVSATGLPIAELCWLDYFFDVTQTVSGCRGHISAEDNGTLYDLFSRDLGFESVDLRFATEILTVKIQDRQAINWSKSASELLRRNSIINVDVSAPVLRAAYEWEMLLARGLTPACLGLDEVSRASEGAKQLFLDALRWTDVLSNALDCFAPVVSLLHFALHGGRPVRRLLSIEEQQGDFQRKNDYFRGSLCNAETSDSLKDVVQETLGMLSLLPLTRRREASAAQLCTSEDVLPRLRNVASCAKALTILDEIQTLTTTINHDARELLVCQTIVDRLALLMEYAKGEQQSSPSTGMLLHSVLSGMKLDNVQTILGEDFNTVFVFRAFRRSSSCSRSHLKSSLEDENYCFLRCITGIVLSNKLANYRSRAFFAETLHDVINNLPDDVNEDGRLSLVLEILNKNKDDALRRLLVEEICFVRERDHDDRSLRKLQGFICSLFSIVLCKGGRALRFKKSGVITKTLLESIEHWWNDPRCVTAQILNLLLLHASVTSELHLIGRAVLTFYKENKRTSSVDIENICFMFNFLSSLQHSLAEKGIQTNATRQDDVLASLPPVCTYIAFSDFRDQHWYQCFTCGLTGDRGCCSRCALICHNGHNVSYARYSSFFCDCGAAQANDGDASRLRCKCLKPGTVVEQKKKFISLSQMNGLEDVPIYVKRVTSLYSKETKAALSLFLKRSGFKDISNEVMTTLVRELKSELDSSSSTGRFENSFQWTYSALRSSLRCRGSSIVGDGSVSFFEPPLRSFFVDDSLNMMISSLQHSYLAEKRISRQVVKSDSRGRLFIGETNSVLICNGFSACDFFGRQRTSDFQGFSRQDLGIFKSIPVHFEVIGLQLAPGNERIVAVWGSHDISILIMNRALVDCERRMTFSLSPDQGGLTDCQWLNGSVRYLVALCRGVLLFYDIEASDKNPIATLKSPVVDGDEVDGGERSAPLQIEGFVCVPIRDLSGSGISSAEIFVVLNNKTLHSTTCTYENQQRNLLCRQIPSGQGLQIGSVSSSSGESRLESPCRISFLTQSSLLVYQDGSFAHGLLIDGRGKIDHSFPILPHRLCVKESGVVTVVTGPYNHWFELGLIRDESTPEPFFRFTCIAREESSDLQVLLFIDFNRDMTKIKVAKMAQNSSLCLDEVIGYAAISFPTIELRTNREETFVCVLTAKGSLISFEDDCLTPLTCSVDPVVDEKGNLGNRPDLFVETDASLLSFEKLKNISEHGHVFYHGGLMESPNEIKTKLLREDDGYVRSPETDGFTLNISMDNFVTRPESLREKDRYVVVAIRALFGSTDIDAIPRNIIVQGTKVDLVPNEKRWYTIHLTMQEIIAAIRCGAISVHISKTFTGSKAIFDGLELYGVERSSLASWIPSSVQSLVAFPHPAGRPDGGIMTRAKRLRLILNGLSNCASTLSCPVPIICGTILRDITTEIFLHRDAGMWDDMKQLVVSAGLPTRESQDLMDDALASSCTILLVKFHGFIAQQQGNTEARRSLWHILRPPLRSYLKAVAAVARLRPTSYLRLVENSSESIALKVRMLLDDDFLRSPCNAEFVSDFVELSLLEIAIAKNFLDDFDSRDKFAGFGILAPLFKYKNRLLVENTVTKVMNFCKKYSVEEDLLEGETDLFASHAMTVVFCCDFCDSGIRDVRYSFVDIDLCRMCYNDAMTYASAHEFSENEDVVTGIDNKKDRPKMTCAEVKRLVPHTVDVESPSLDTSGKASGRDRAQVFKRRQLFGTFIDDLLCMIGNLIAVEIEKHEILVSHLIALMNELSHVSEQDSSHDRATWLAGKLIEGVSRVLQRVPPGQLQANEVPSLLGCVQRFTSALSSLVIPDKEARNLLINPINDDGSSIKLDKESTRSKCNHGIPATRHDIDCGPMNGRSFYSCSMKSKAHKCNYFEWSDSSLTHGRPLFNENVAQMIWELLSKPQSGRTASIQELLSYFLKQLLSTIEASPCELAMSAGRIARQASSEEVLNDFNDGAFCSKSRLYDSLEVCIHEHHRQSPISSVTQARSILELVALVAEGVEGDSWFDPLCTILVSPHEDTSSFRSLAKRCLFKLCGTPARFLEVRDRYLFKSRFQLLMNRCQDLTDYFLLVNKKACRHKRKNQDEENLNWKQLSLHEIVAATDLISENASLQDCSSMFGTALDELLLHASKRPMNWKSFCWSKDSKPASNQCCDANNYPLFEVLALPSIMAGGNRIKAMRLASLAFDPRDSSAIVAADMTSTPTCGIQEDDIFAFVVRFVCGDESQDVRHFAMIVARGLCGGEREAARLFVRLLKRNTCMIGSMGKLFVEFFALLNALVRATKKECIDLHSMLAAVEHLFYEQITADYCDQLEGATYCFEKRKNAAIQRTKFDLIPCGHVVSRPPSKTKVKRHPEQIGQFVRFRLKTGPDSTSSNEFNHFLSLPHRSVISEIHVEINGPRGRFVKSINLYYSPRPVNSPLHLRETEYPFWKPCGRLTLERGAEKISMKFDDPFVASNLRIEFEEFYERPGRHQSDEFVVHCPRCMRVVTNAHGVCGSCGEAAFQCPKCRHINYDRVNAFICVECGYCASGGLSYELTAAVATNAVAITCDNDYQESLSMFTAASKISEDLQLALREGLNALSLNHQQHHKRKPAVDDSALITRAFEGQLPLKPGSIESKFQMPSLKQFDKRGSVVKAVAQNRKCTSDGGDNSTSRQPVVRHLGGFDRDDFDDASEFFGGLLESSGMSRGLDRLMASVQRQREQNGNRDQTERNARLHQSFPLNGATECDQLYQLVHEAQRECFRLERRIEAWQRLETGSLIDENQASSPGFQPSRCSYCSPLVTRQLLMLWHSLFLLDPQTAQINEGMLAILLAEDATSVKDVQEVKRKIVKDIAVLSKKGRSAVLEALSCRRMIDRHCAEIIGNVLKEEVDAEIVNPFLSLADRVLDCDLAL